MQNIIIIVVVLLIIYLVVKGDKCENFAIRAPQKVRCCSCGNVSKAYCKANYTRCCKRPRVAAPAQPLGPEYTDLGY